MISPIETAYKGFRFRSRLEARWAIFFDSLNIKWEYEAEAFKLADGSIYLPDFHLPTFDREGMFVEVKPKLSNSREVIEQFAKAKEFAIQMKVKLWMAKGPPDFEVQSVFVGSEECFWPSMLPNWGQAKGDNRMFWGVDQYTLDRQIEDGSIFQESLYGAVMASRNFRFYK